MSTKNDREIVSGNASSPGRTKPGRRGFAGRSEPIIPGTPTLPTTGKITGGGSYLADETTKMDRERRLLEQQGHRQLARVHAREHPEDAPSSPEGEPQNTIAQHPWLDSPQYDGIDPSLNPEPPLNTDARREFDNERREQEMEKQLRLGNMPKFSTAPKPQGP